MYITHKKVVLLFKEIVKVVYMPLAIRISLYRQNILSVVQELSLYINSEKILINLMLKCIHFLNQCIICKRHTLPFACISNCFESLNFWRPTLEDSKNHSPLSHIVHVLYVLVFWLTLSLLFSVAWVFMPAKVNLLHVIHA